MTKYVALLRGINVLGKNMIKMETLRETFAALGFENVRTYINSGNVIFETASSDEARLAKKIHDAILRDFGFDISVMIRSVAEIKRMIENNPFVGQFDNHKDLHLFFLNDELTAEQHAMLFAHANENEMFAVIDRHIFSLLRIPFPDSAVCKGLIDKKMKVPSTARNWRTVNKIVEL